MTSLGVVIVGRNDFYGGNLVERASYCINSLVSTFDEVIYVDWNVVNNKTLIEEIYDNLIETDKLKIIKISPELASEFTNHDPNAQTCSETLGKNIGFRRLETDFILSTSIEDICPRREDLVPLSNSDIFYIGARRGTPLESVVQTGGYKNFPDIQDNLKVIQSSFPQVGPSGAYPGDTWSIINCCGDFQFASRKLWYEMKGFEEFLVYRGFLDTNIQKKVMLSGRRVELHTELPVFHINHTNGFGGFGGINDMNRAIRNFSTSSNKDTWGFSEYGLDMIPMSKLKE